MNELSRWDTLSDPDAPSPKTESGLSELFQEIRSTVDTEAQIVKAVFPNPPVVMQVFLQRVFAQPVCVCRSILKQPVYRGIGSTTRRTAPTQRFFSV
jgi:exocyst complex component 5